MRLPSRSTHRCGARPPGHAFCTYSATGFSTDGGVVPSGATAPSS